jgi:hypothetical protein
MLSTTVLCSFMAGLVDVSKKYGVFITGAKK